MGERAWPMRVEKRAGERGSPWRIPDLSGILVECLYMLISTVSSVYMEVM